MGPPKLSSNKRRAQVGHPWRLKAAKMPVAKSKPDKSMYVWLLDNPLEGDINEFMFQEDQVLLKGYVNINPDETAEEIRKKLCLLLKTKFELIGPNDFDYVKRDRNKISLPVTQPGFLWNFASLKSLTTGQGKLYLCVKHCYRDILGIGANNEDTDAIKVNVFPVIRVVMTVAVSH